MNEIVETTKKEEIKEEFSEKELQKHKSHVRLFFLFLLVALALLGYLTYQLVIFFMNIN